MEAVGVVGVLGARYQDLEDYLVATFRLEHRHTVLAEIMVKTVARVMRYQDKYDPTKSAPFSWVVGIARSVAFHELGRRTERKGVRQDRDVMEDGAWGGGLERELEDHQVDILNTLIREQTPPWETL